ncbi:MAG: hypothetical protein V3V22_05485 [Methylococcales bacterium]
MKKTLPKLSGVTLALAAASLLPGCASNGSNSDAMVDTVNLVQCSGVNKCNGHNDCKTAKNACGGHAACKGQGFVVMPKKACSDVGGTITSVTDQAVSSADLIHCSGVNQCKGHNDCKTANNACAGQASCKGQGFVNTTAKSCDDIGGVS